MYNVPYQCVKISSTYIRWLKSIHPTQFLLISQRDIQISNPRSIALFTAVYFITSRLSSFEDQENLCYATRTHYFFLISLLVVIHTSVYYFSQPETALRVLEFPDLFSSSKCFSAPKSRTVLATYVLRRPQDLWLRFTMTKMRDH
jgi:hypothetical protein